MDQPGKSERSRVILLMSPSTYRAAAFVEAAQRVGIGVVSIVDMPEHLSEYWHQAHGVDFSNMADATSQIVRIAMEEQAAAVLSVDDSATELAAYANRDLGFAHNTPESAVAARDKFVMRSVLLAGGVKCPRFEVVAANADPASIASPVGFPCVVKPLRLSGSRGVIRADNQEELEKAVTRLQRILTEDGSNLDNTQILIEEYLPGDEVAVEGLLTGGELHVLAIFDKPDPLVGPFFEETIYVTPSRHQAEVQRAIGDEVTAAARALGLREGPIHAELRVYDRGAWILEVAGRSIGGLCSSILSFGAGMGLEELILRHAAGMQIPSFDRAGSSVGVMMIPIPRAGLLKSVGGEEEACAVPGVTGLEITAKLNYPIVPLPEGAAYLGFIFARGESPEEVEVALRDAHDKLKIRIDPLVALMAQGPVAAGS